HPVGTMPLQLTALLAIERSHRDANVVLHQVTQQSAHRALLLELLEQQTHDALHLLVGVNGESSRRALDVSDRRMTVGLAAPGLVEHALVHADAHHVQLRLVDGALEQCIITHICYTFAEPESVSWRIADTLSAASSPP